MLATFAFLAVAGTLVFAYSRYHDRRTDDLVDELDERREA